jgi:tetratricopeptide (TPR) repeat protein
MRAAQVLASYSVLGLCFAVPFAFSQTGGQTGGSSTTKNTPSAPTRPTLPPMQQERRLVFLSGRVMLDDGTELQEPASIERVCNGQVQRETYTGLHGQFGFQMGAEIPGFQDATVGGSSDQIRNSPLFANPQAPGTSLGMASQGVTQEELMSCELRASLPGFRSDSIPLAGRHLFDDPNVGTIVLHRVGKVEGTSISATTLGAPKDAKKAFQRGTHLLKEHKPTEATEAFAKAVALYPKYAEAMVKLGEIYMDGDRGDDAGKLFQRAIEADAKFIPPYFDLALLTARKHDWKRVADLTDRALALNAYEYPAMYYLNAVGNYNLHNFDVAEKNARMARKLDSQYHIPRIDLVLANVLLQRRDYAGAAEQLRSFLNHAPSGEEADQARELLAHIESTLAAAAPAASAVATPK